MRENERERVFEGLAGWAGPLPHNCGNSPAKPRSWRTHLVLPKIPAAVVNTPTDAITATTAKMARPSIFSYFMFSPVRRWYSLPRRANLREAERYLSRNGGVLEWRKNRDRTPSQPLPSWQQPTVSVGFHFTFVLLRKTATPGHLRSQVATTSKFFRRRRAPRCPSPRLADRQAGNRPVQLRAQHPTLNREAIKAPARRSGPTCCATARLSPAPPPPGEQSLSRS
jgi:hypothetical protein